MLAHGKGYPCQLNIAFTFSSKGYKSLGRRARLVLAADIFTLIVNDGSQRTSVATAETEGVPCGIKLWCYTPINYEGSHFLKGLSYLAVFSDFVIPANVRAVNFDLLR